MIVQKNEKKILDDVEGLLKNREPLSINLDRMVLMKVG